MRLVKITAAAFLFGADFASAQAAEIKVFVPPVMNQGGVPDLAKAFTAKTGIKVTVTNHSMGRIDERHREGPGGAGRGLPADGLHGHAGARQRHQAGQLHAGRARLYRPCRAQGLAHSRHLHGGQARRGAQGVEGITYSIPRPARGSVEAGMIDQLLHRPELIGAKGIFAPTGPDGKLGPNGPA